MRRELIKELREKSNNYLNSDKYTVYDKQAYEIMYDYDNLMIQISRYKNKIKKLLEYNTNELKNLEDENCKLFEVISKNIELLNYKERGNKSEVQ